MKTATKKRVSMMTTLASLAAFVPMTQIQAAPEVYGRLDVALENVDMDGAAVDPWEIESYASRLGFKGEEQVSDTLTAIYKYELEIDPEEDSINDNNDGSFLKARTQFVGLKGGFGKIRLGRMDTPVKQSQAKVDLFGDHAADIKNYMEGENRIGDTINYTTPSFSGAQIQVALIQGEGTADLDGDGTNDDGIADAFSASLTYKADQLYLAVAVDSDVDSQDIVRLVASYNMDAYAFGFLYQTAEGNGTSPDEETGLMLSAALKQGAYKYKLQYGTAEVETAAGATTSDVSTIAFGVDRKLSKMTKAYAELTQYSDDLVSNNDTTVIALGMQKKF